MNPEHVRSDSEVAKCGWKWKQMGHEEKKAAVNAEMKRMQRLPPNSSYVSHRLRVLNKIQQLLSLQVLVEAAAKLLEFRGIYNPLHFKDYITGGGVGVALLWASYLKQAFWSTGTGIRK